jgi:hypothetical protein
MGCHVPSFGGERHGIGVVSDGNFDYHGDEGEDYYPSGFLFMNCGVIMKMSMTFMIMVMLIVMIMGVVGHLRL